jgi:Protein of unknown function (DUF4019)
MRFKLVLCVMLCVAWVGPNWEVQAQQGPELLAQASNAEWLALVDAAKYGESWEAASAPVKTAVSKEQWTKSMTDNRSPLGAMVTRVLASSAYSKKLPGAPDGEYVMTLYTTRFEHKETAQETVISVREKDGQWRVAGYYFK